MSASTEPPRLRSRRGALTLALLCAVQLLDVVDSSITNVAFPSIRRDLLFSQQGLQWVASGYLLTFGGFLLLGGRLADLLGRRRVLVAGLAGFAIGSLAAGVAESANMLVGARFVQGLGAALMAPAALSILTTTFRDPRQRNTALGVWGSVSGLGAAAGVFLGGVLSEGPGWRWVFYVNLPVVIGALAGALALLDGRRERTRSGSFDLRGALLATGGMLVLVYALIKAPDVGWGTARTLGSLAGAASLLVAFVVNEHRSPSPLMPLTILRVRGLVAADATQLIAMAGFFSTFFFLTLYMQQVLGYSPIQAGAAYLPVTASLALAAGGSSQLFARIGTRPVIVTGALVSATAIAYLSRVPLDATYATDLLPGLVVMALGFGAVFVGVTTAANAGVPADKAGLAAGLLSASQQLGMALGLAILSAIATARTHDALAVGDHGPAALTTGYGRALAACSVLVAAAAIIAARIPTTRAAAPPILVGADSPPEQAPGVRARA